MRYPKQMRFKGVLYTIQQVDKLKGIDTFGDISFKSKKIRLKRRNKDKFAVFLHECFHAVLYESGIKHLDVDFEETIVETLSCFCDKHMVWK